MCWQYLTFFKRFNIFKRLQTFLNLVLLDLVCLIILHIWQKKKKKIWKKIKFWDVKNIFWFVWSATLNSVRRVIMSNCCLFVRYLCVIGALLVLYRYAFIGSSCKLVCVKKIKYISISLEFKYFFLLLAVCVVRQKDKFILKIFFNWYGLNCEWKFNK